MTTKLGMKISSEQHHSVIKPEDWRDQIDDLLKALDELAVAE